MDRTYDDFEWLQQQLFFQEDMPGIEGVIVSTLLLYNKFNILSAHNLLFVF